MLFKLTFQGGSGMAPLSFHIFVSWFSVVILNEEEYGLPRIKEVLVTI